MAPDGSIGAVTLVHFINRHNTRSLDSSTEPDGSVVHDGLAR